MADPSVYCDDADVYEIGGLARGALPNPGRIVASVDTSTNVLTLDGHGFRSGSELLFRAEGGGSLPTGLVAGTTYYALPQTDSTFKVSATLGGAAVDITTTGARFLVTVARPMLLARQWASGMLDELLPAHVVPLTAPYPVTVRGAAAELAAWKLGGSSGGMGTESLTAKLKAAKDVLDRWARGVPIRGANVPPAANLAAVATSAGLDPRGWAPTDGSLP